jgi:hypothetical protein
MLNPNRFCAVMLSAGYRVGKKASVEKLDKFFNKKLKYLYRDNPEFKNLLDSETSYLDKYEESYPTTARSSFFNLRWKYFINEDTQEHLCPVCGKFIDIYKLRYCCHFCSTQAPKTGEKTGPKIDLVEREKFLKKLLKERRPDYKVKTFGYKRSIFEHDCGQEFEATNESLIKPPQECKGNRYSRYCPCQQRKTFRRTEDSIKKLLIKNEVPFDLASYDPEEPSVAYFKHKSCGHICMLPVQYVSLLSRCTVCYPDPMLQTMTEEEYIAQLAVEKPTFKLVGKYTNTKTFTRYKHITCGQEFDTYPNNIKRARFHCPVCTCKSSGGVFEITLEGRRFRVRGMEEVALNWILANTSIKVPDIICDGDLDISPVDYFDTGREKWRKYRPDFKVGSRNMIIEVKSKTTLGLTRDPFFYHTAEELWNLNRDKAKAVLAKGYKFILLVFDTQNRRIQLPKNWYNLSHKTILDWYADKTV